MKQFSGLVRLAIAGGLALLSVAAQAEKYQFKFYANPTIFDAVPDPTQDVMHTVVLDDSKIGVFDAFTLQATSTWLSGGIDMSMSYQGQTVRLNDGLDAGSPTVQLPGSHGPEGFISLDWMNEWFFALEFAADNPFVVAHGLPFDPFVNGFLWVIQDQQSYLDFRSLWLAGNTAVLESYRFSEVPEPAALALAGIGLIAGLGSAKRRRPGAVGRARA